MAYRNTSRMVIHIRGDHNRETACGHGGRDPIFANQEELEALRRGESLAYWRFCKRCAKLL